LNEIGVIPKECVFISTAPNSGMNFSTFARVENKVNGILHFIRRLMEEAGLLNYLDETNLYCLYTVFFSLMDKSVAMNWKILEFA
jgi:hypothetical protein